MEILKTKRKAENCAWLAVVFIAPG